MLLAIIADTHMPRGARRLPDTCRERLSRADRIVHLGDFTERAVLADLESLGPPVDAVYGNMDSRELRRLLPERRTIELAGIRIGMVHDGGPAQGRISRLRRLFPDAAAALFAHSHLPLHQEDGGFQIFNPGSPTERRRAPARSMGLAEVTESSLTFEHIPLSGDF